MNNKKCVNCGFINFASAESCRKCEAGLFDLDREPGSYSSAGTYQPSYARVTPTEKKTSAIKVVLLSILGLMVVSGVAGGVKAIWRPGAKVEWKEFYPPQGAYRVMMPSEPKTIEPVTTPFAMGSMTTHGYSSTVPGQGSVMYCVVSFSGGVSTRSLPYDKVLKALDDELNNLLSKTNSTLVSKKAMNYDGFPGLEFEVRPPGNLALQDAKGFGKIIVMEHEEYLFMVTASEGSDLLYNRDTFLNASSK